MTDTAPTTPPLGFTPRSSIRPLWLHTIELNPDRSLAGTVVVVRRDVFDGLLAIVEFISDRDDLTAIVHGTDGEVWVRLTRAQSIDLRRRLGELNEQTSPFGDDAYDAYSALTEIENILDGEGD